MEKKELNLTCGQKGLYPWTQTNLSTDPRLKLQVILKDS